MSTSESDVKNAFDMESKRLSIKAPEIRYDKQGDKNLSKSFKKTAGC